MTHLTELATHYEFGRNWAEYAARLPEKAVDEAIAGLARLIPPVELAGRSLLDVGCGSGLHALAALRLGAARVHGIDIDPDSVGTARQLLTRFAPGEAWTLEQRSVFDSAGLGRFDIVYSWGVLHHTGDMACAVRMAADRVRPGGLLCLALYRRTPMCRFWRAEKWAYTNAPSPLRRIVELGYITAFKASLAVTGRSHRDYVAQYVQQRGMEWMTDVRDWLGGYPYESISEAEMLAMAQRLGLTPVRRFCRKPGLGLLGNGCDEYVFARA
jgi:2-polyprenyl-6-hydroxyphenyl methylase/3-demethylubiquinone-9 3-methyltransferase